jgi:DNA-3-methyladenine glycosylase I
MQKNFPVNRCPWCGTDPLYIEYHDREWGVPVHEDRHLFEMLILEGAQAGLSWLTILRKRAAYRAAFDQFDPEKIATYGASKIRTLLANPGIVRNRLKIEAAIANARACLRIVEEYGSLSTYLWRFVDGRPIRNRWRSLSQVPVYTPESDRMSRELRRHGFKFVGTTICYAFMQSVGMVNDHLTGCFRHALIARLSARG